MTTQTTPRLRASRKPTPGLIAAKGAERDLERAESHLRADDRLAMHTFSCSQRTKAGVVYRVYKYAGDTGEFMGLVECAKGEENYIEPGDVDPPFASVDPNKVQGLGWTKGSPKKPAVSGTPRDVKKESKKAAKKPLRKPVKKPLRKPVKKPAKKVAKKAAKKATKKKAQSTTPILNGVKLYPAHHKTLATVVEHGPAAFNLATVMDWHAKDKTEMAKNWCRRTILELCKAGLLERTEDRGYYIVTKEGTKFHASMDDSFKAA